MRTGAWANTQAERTVFSRANIVKLRAVTEGLSHGGVLVLNFRNARPESYRPPPPRCSKPMYQTLK